MPLPHFLLMLAFVIGAAALTVWALSASALPHAAVAITALLAAAAVGLVGRER